MGKSKKIIIGSVAGVTAAAVGVSGFLLWKNHQKKSTADGIAYVSSVSDINTAAATVSDLRFSGVVEPQETKEIKIDTSKTISEVSVKEGDHVEAGDALFTYDIASMKLELEQGNVEIERMQNEIASSQQQITQLESEKKSASADDKLSYTTQIQSLQTDIAKTQYDIKTKQIELDKLQNTIDNAVVKADFAGTVQSLKTVEQLQSDGGDVIMKIMSDGEYRVKCVASEQNLYMLSKDETMTLSSRTDDTTWTGTISEIGTEPVSNDQSTMYYSSSDDMTTASKYPFYVTLDSGDGLMLGQHLLVSPSDGGTVEKSGIWLYTGYVVTEEDGTSYVWATDQKDRLEKRKVEVGQTDDIMGDCEIVSGLKESDKIAYPSDSYQEGMKTTTNPEEATPEEDSDTDGSDDDSVEPDLEESGYLDENGNLINDGEFLDEGDAGTDGGEDTPSNDGSADGETIGEVGDTADSEISAADSADTEEGGAADGN